MNRCDQLVKRFKIKDSSGTYITPQNSYDVSIKVGSVEKTYRKNELTFDSVNNCYEFPLTQDMTLNLSLSVEHQERVIYKVNGVYTILSTKVQKLPIGESIFTKYVEGN